MLGVCGTWSCGVSFFSVCGGSSWHHLSPLCSAGCGMCEHFDTAASEPSVFIDGLTLTNVCSVMPKRIPTKTCCFCEWEGPNKHGGGTSLKIDIRDREALLRAFKQNWTDFICVSECKSRGYVSLYVFDYCNKFPRLIQIRLLIICVQLISFLV